MSAQPRCPCCGKPIPKLTRTVWIWGLDSNIHQRDTDWSRNLYMNLKPRSIAECRQLTNQQVVSVSYSHDRTVRRFEEWDGERYWSRHQPFCTTACAMRFARAAYKAGYRMVEKEGVP